MKSFHIILTASLASTIYARTDLAGCISSATTNQWHEASMIWYVPGTGEICDFPDCGGGRAPPKSDNPACPLYTGTATYEPSYLPGYGPGAVASTTTLAATTAAATTTAATTTAEDSTSAIKQVAESVTITSSPGVGASASSTLMTTRSVGGGGGSSSSSVGSLTSGSAGATETPNSVGSLRCNGFGAVGVIALLVGLVF